MSDKQNSKKTEKKPTQTDITQVVSDTKPVETKKKKEKKDKKIPQKPKFLVHIDAFIETVESGLLKFYAKQFFFVRQGKIIGRINELHIMLKNEKGKAAMGFLMGVAKAVEGANPTTVNVKLSAAIEGVNYICDYFRKRRLYTNEIMFLRTCMFSSEVVFIVGTAKEMKLRKEDLACKVAQLLCVRFLLFIVSLCEVDVISFAEFLVKRIEKSLGDEQYAVIDNPIEKHLAASFPPRNFYRRKKKIFPVLWRKIINRPRKYMNKYEYYKERKTKNCQLSFGL